MTDVNYSDLLVELLTSNDTYQHLVEAIDSLFANNIDLAIAQIGRLRSLRQTDDVNLRIETLRMLGFDISADFLTSNTDATGQTNVLAQIPYMFSLYHENAHNNDFWRFISFLLGRRISITPLYTNDYRFFYEEPQGTENIDGGDWYKTTHIDVAIGIENLYSNIIANVNKTYIDRVTDLFYEYTPIQLVVRNMFYALYCDVSQIGFTAADSIDRSLVAIGGNGLYGGQSLSELHDIAIIGDPSLSEGETRQYRLELIWSDTFSDYINFERFTTSSNLVTIGHNGNILCKRITRNRTFDLNATYAGFSATKTITLIAAESKPTIFAIAIDGPDNVDENTIVAYSIRIIWSDDNETTQLDGANCKWSTISSHLFFADSRSGEATIKSVTRQTKARIDVRYKTATVNLKASREISINQVDSRVFLLSIGIFGPASLTEQSTYSYQCKAIYSDSNVPVIINPIWYLKSTAATISLDGKLITNRVEQSLDMTLYAEYEYRGIKKRAQKTLALHHAEYTIIDASIIGPEIVLAKRRAQYHLSVLWSDGTRTFVKADSWTATSFSIDESGSLLVGAINDNLWIEITALFSYKGATYSYTQAIRAVQFNVTLDFVSIRGQLNLKSTEICTMSAYAYYSDGSRLLLEASKLTWSVDETYAQIDSAGVLSIQSTPNTTFATVRVVYTADTDYTAVHYIAILQPLTYIDSIVISGPETAAESSTEQYIAIARYYNEKLGVFEQHVIEPDWLIFGTETQYEAQNLAKIDRHGFLYVRPLKEQTVIILKATFFGTFATKKVTLTAYTYPKKLPPYSARIEGPSIIDSELGFADYELLLRDSVDSVEYAVSPSWSLSVRPEMAVVDANGLIRVYIYSGVNTTLTAMYACGYADQIIVTKSIKLPSAFSLGEALITGPITVHAGTETLYSAHITDASNNYIDITTLPDTVWTIEGQLQSLITLSNTGVLTVDAQSDSANVVLHVEYNVDGHSYVGRLQVAITINVSTVNITGAVALHDNMSSQYSAHITDYTGNVVDITAAQTTTWTIVDSFSELLTLSNSGQLTVAALNSPHDIQLRVDYHDSLHYYSSTFTVSLTITLHTLTISGLTEIPDHTTTQYTATIVDINDNVLNVTLMPDTVWSLNITQPNVVLGNDGILTVDILTQSSTVIVQARYSDAYYHYEGTLPVHLTYVRDDIVLAVGPFGINSQTLLEQFAVASTITQSGDIQSLQLDDLEYAYLAHPVSYGIAAFFVPGDDIQSGWDGATWPINGVGDTYGPITIDYTKFGVTKSYYLYRTDFEGLGPIQYQIFFEHFL